MAGAFAFMYRGVHCAVAGRAFSIAHQSYSGRWRGVGTAMRGGAPPGMWHGSSGDDMGFAAAHHSSHGSSSGELARRDDERDLGLPVSISTILGLRSYP